MNIRYKRLVEDYYKNEEGILKWIVLSGKPIRKKRKGYLELNIEKTIRLISKKYFGKKI
jgi:hypothetical protein